MIFRGSRYQWRSNCKYRRNSKRTRITSEPSDITELLQSLVAQTVRNLPAMWETQIPSLSWEDPPEKGMATHSNIPAWRIPWTEKPGGLQPMASQRVRHDWVTNSELNWMTFRGIKCKKREDICVSDSLYEKLTQHYNPTIFELKN